NGHSADTGIGSASLCLAAPPEVWSRGIFDSDTTLGGRCFLGTVVVPVSVGRAGGQGATAGERIKTLDGSSVQAWTTRPSQPRRHAGREGNLPRRRHGRGREYRQADLGGPAQVSRSTAVFISWHQRGGSSRRPHTGRIAFPRFPPRPMELR